MDEVEPIEQILFFVPPPERGAERINQSTTRAYRDIE